jgi:hypothetical protein
MTTDEQSVREAVRRHHAAPEAPVEQMWAHIAAAVPRARARRRRSRLLTLAAGVAAMVIGVAWWGGGEPMPIDARRVELDAGWTRLPEATARALRTSLSELDAAISDLDAVLRSDPADQTVKDMRARFSRQRDAWLDRALQDLRQLSGA